MTFLMFLSYLCLFLSFNLLVFALHPLYQMSRLRKDKDNGVIKAGTDELIDTHQDTFNFAIVFAMMFGVLSIVPLETGSLDTKSMITLICMVMSIALILFMDRKEMTRTNYIILGTSVLTFAVGIGFQFI